MSIGDKPSLESAVVPYIDAAGHSVMVAIAKATWEIRPTGLVPSSNQVPIEYVDIHVNDNPSKELRVPSDLTDFKPAAEVLVVRPAFAVDLLRFAGNNIGIRIGALSFSGFAGEPWPFGPVSRGDKSRLRYAGTYDERWQRNRMPLLPDDFDARYNQTAPEAQMVRGYFSGDEEVTISGLNTDGIVFSLPALTVLVSANVRQDYFSAPAILDTILVWSENLAITLVWRYVIRPRQKIAEIGPVTLSLIRTRTARELYG